MYLFCMILLRCDTAILYFLSYGFEVATFFSTITSTVFVLAKLIFQLVTKHFRIFCSKNEEFFTFLNAWLRSTC